MPWDAAPTATPPRSGPSAGPYPARWLTAALLWCVAGWAAALGGEEQPPPDPAVSVIADLAHISPAGSPGVRDVANLVAAVEIQQTGGVAKAYRLVISDEGGRPVRTIAGGDGEPAPAPLTRLLIDVGLQERTSVEVPASFPWDGRSDAGALVPDGIYRYVLEITDDYGNRGASEPRRIMVDNTPPSITVSPEYRIFSPDGDGGRDDLPVLQSGSSEVRWIGQFLNAAGDAVRTFRWTDGLPGDFRWDGRGDDGEPLPDGTYRYRVGARDLAGNETAVTVDEIRIDTAARRVGIDLEAPAFSPNDDGVQDEMRFPVTVDLPDSLTDWRAEVRDAGGRIMRTMTGPPPVPQTLIFDGRGDHDEVLPEGDYSLLLSAFYDNGSTRVTESPPFRLDVTAPDAFVTLQHDRFSPNGDGVRDLLLATQEAFGDASWLATIADERGEPVWSRHLEDVNVTLRWDGRDGRGEPVADGSYTYVLSARDGAGNAFSSRPLVFTVDTRETPVALRVGGTHFSPNGDGAQDTVEVVPELMVTDSIESLQVEIADAGGKVWYRDRSPAAVEPFEWTGLANDGRPFPDGEYAVRLSVRYANGNSGAAEAGPIVLDTQFPTIEASTDDLLFSPDGDGNKDDLLIAQTSSAEERWQARFLDQAGEVVATADWTGQVADYRWDGMGDQGTPVADGTYQYEVTATDAAGNSVTARLPGIRVDTRPTAATVGVAQADRAGADRAGAVVGFSPNADGERDVLTFTLSATRDVPVETWSLTVLDADDAPVRIFRGGRELPEEQRWDGRATTGAPAPDGEYRAVFAVGYRKGDVVEDRLAMPIILDTVYPAFEVEAGWLLFSPDGDGRRDVIEVTHAADAEYEWHTELTAADGTIVSERTVRDGVLEDLVWDGTDERGNVVADGEYRYRVRGTDLAGNVTRGELPPIVVDTRPGGAWMEASTAGFSPNGDGVDDEVFYELRVTEDVELQSWELTIAGAAGGAVRTYRGVSGTIFPARLPWDGSDDGGDRVPDGEYTATFRVEYVKGNVGEAAGQAVALDTRPPAVRVGAAYLLFSPDGDGRRDTITLTHEATPGDRWDATITDDRDGSVVLRRVWDAEGPLPDLEWDGRTDEGAAVPDGTYTYRIASVDTGGNSVSAVLEGIRIDTAATAAAVAPDGEFFSPNGDGERDTIDIRISATTDVPIDRWAVSIFDGTGRPVRVFAGGRGADPLPEVIVWDGTADGGDVVPDGFYRASLGIEYVKGNVSEADGDPFLVDSSPPQAAIRTELDTPSLPFSPDDDGVNDHLMIFLDASDEGGIDAWALEIVDPQGEVFTATSGRGSPPAFGWDGYSVETGELVEAAVDYTLRLQVSDHVGNRATATKVLPIDVLVLRAGDRLRIRISSIHFAPNTADYQRLGDLEKTRRNLRTLDRLAEILGRYATYNILLEGHAVSVHWADVERARQEQAEVLVPLSAARAAAVRDALVERGIRASRMTTTGLGGAHPVVPHDDTRNRWKNRRVEAWLIRQ